MNGQPGPPLFRDVSFDQGGMVGMDWDNSPADDRRSSLVTSYWVQRGLAGGPAPSNARVVDRSMYLNGLASQGTESRTFMKTHKVKAPLSPAGDVYWRSIGS